MAGDTGGKRRNYQGSCSHLLSSWPKPEPEVLSRGGTYPESGIHIPPLATRAERESRKQELREEATALVQVGNEGSGDQVCVMESYFCVY